MVKREIKTGVIACDVCKVEEVPIENRENQVVLDLPWIDICKDCASRFVRTYDIITTNGIDDLPEFIEHSERRLNPDTYYG